MNRNPFFKPPSAEPLPEQEWLRRTDRAGVKREPFFCGRDAEYEVFRNAAIDLRDGNADGGTLIFQGAPGAGKTALMLECAEAVRLHSTPQEPWVAASVDSGTLSFPADVVSCLVDAANAEIERLSKVAERTVAGQFNELLNLGRRLYEELSSRGVSPAGFSIGGKAQSDSGSDSAQSAQSYFRQAAELLAKFHIVVFVDEAQNTPEVGATKAVLDCLHRDPKGIPLVAAFFGLSNTEDVLRRCGLSRLADGRIVNMDPLSLADAKTSIRQMLDAYYAGSVEQKDVWANALSELSQGWPQHINRVGVAAGRVIRANQGRLAPQLLERVIEKGIERKNDYYDRRVAAGYLQPELYIRLALAAAQNASGDLSVDELRELSASELEKNQTPFDDFLRQSLHAGVLAPTKGLLIRYKFPIPSLGDYLRSAAAGPVNLD